MSDKNEELPELLLGPDEEAPTILELWEPNKRSYTQPVSRKDVLVVVGCIVSYLLFAVVIYLGIAHVDNSRNAAEEQARQQVQAETNRRATEVRERTARQERERKDAEERRLQELADQLVMPTKTALPTQTAFEPVELKTERGTVPGAAWTRIVFKMPKGANQTTGGYTEFFAGSCWSPAGDAFYVMLTDGQLYRCSYPDLKITRLALEQRCNQMFACKLGLVVVSERTEELWLFDPVAAKVVRRIGIQHLMTGMSAPSLEGAYVFCRPYAFNQTRTHHRPIWVDLTDGELTLMGMEIPSDPWNNSTPEFRAAQLSPDGRWFLYTNWGGNGIRRYRVDDYRVIEDGSFVGDPPYPFPTSIVSISTDAEKVIQSLTDRQYGGGSTFAVYSLRQPELPPQMIDAQHYLGPTASDPQTRRLFFRVDRKNKFASCDESGGRRREYELDAAIDDDVEIERIIPHPTDGRGCLIQLKGRFALLEFDAE